MRKIYLAARWMRRDEMSVYADILKDDGHEITSTWVYGNEEGLTREGAAMLDFNDVKRADTFIGFNEGKGTLFTGGGRHTEFGLAYAWGHECLFVNNFQRSREYEQIFHSLPKLGHHETFNEVREYLNRYPER